MDIKDIALDVVTIVENKNKDYGNSFSKTMDEYGNAAYFIRIEDKLNRLKNLLNTEYTSLVNESVEDTLKDIIGYTLLMIDYSR